MAEAGGYRAGVAASGGAQEHAAVPVEDLDRLALLGRGQRQGVRRLGLQAQPRHAERRAVAERRDRRDQVDAGSDGGEGLGLGQQLGPQSSGLHGELDRFGDQRLGQAAFGVGGVGGQIDWHDHRHVHAFKDGDFPSLLGLRPRIQRMAQRHASQKRHAAGMSQSAHRSSDHDWLMPAAWRDTGRYRLNRHDVSVRAVRAVPAPQGSGSRSDGLPDDGC